jgi:amidase
VTDVALVLDATVGYDPADPITATGNGKIPSTYTSALQVDALKGARIGVIGEFFGTAPEDDEVGVVVRRALDDMKARGATGVETVVPNLAQQLTASNLLTQELKFYLGDYLRTSPASSVRSVEELIASGLHSAQLQGFLEGANAIPDNYLTSDDYKSRLAAREALGRALITVMDANRLDALLYPTVRRIAPLAGGNQLGSNAGLSAQTGFPAITVPAGFTADGLPVGVELLGRPFAEATLLGLAYAYERATSHRRPPSSTPSPIDGSRGRSAGAASSDTGPGSVAFEVTATGAQSIPPADPPFGLVARFSFNADSRRLGFQLRPSGAARQVGGVYLHRRANRQNGGVAHILAKSLAGQNFGVVTLTVAEVADLRAGKLYVAAVSAKDPRLSARGVLVLP